MLAIGTGIALLPETVFSFALAKVPAGAVTTSLLLLFFVLSPALTFAQGQTVSVKQRSALRRQMEDQIICTCGCLAPMGSCQMRPNCSHYDEQSVRLDMLLNQGLDGDAVKASFVQAYGSEAVLAAPIDKGFNRLAWAVPYLAGLVALGFVIFTARRWGHGQTPDAPAETSVDPTLDARVEDELRNLD
jgi:cytochrome c-type biogenesis protein CcmH/NrfF